MKRPTATPDVRLTRKKYKPGPDKVCLVCLEPCTDEDVEVFPCCGSAVHAGCLRQWQAGALNTSMACMVCKSAAAPATQAFTATRAALAVLQDHTGDVSSHLLRVAEFTLNAGRCSVPLLRVRWAAPSVAHWAEQLVSAGLWAAHAFDAAAGCGDAVIYDAASTVRAMPWDQEAALQRFPLPLACAPWARGPSQRSLLVPVCRSNRDRVQALVACPHTLAQHALAHRGQAWCLFIQDAGAPLAPGAWARGPPSHLPVTPRANVWHADHLALPRRPHAGVGSMKVKFYGAFPSDNAGDTNDTEVQQAVQSAELSRICAAELITFMRVVLPAATRHAPRLRSLGAEEGAAAAGEARGGTAPWAEPETLPRGLHHGVA